MRKRLPHCFLAATSILVEFLIIYMKKLTFEELSMLEDMTNITRVDNGKESRMIKLCTVPHPHTQEKVVYVIQKVADDKCFCVMNNKLFDRAHYFSGEIDYKQIAKLMIAQVEFDRNDWIESIKQVYKFED